MAAFFPSPAFGTLSRVRERESPVNQTPKGFGFS